MADSSSAWARFTAADNLDDFCQGWLAILCGQVAHTRVALLLLRHPREVDLKPAAIWPDAGVDLQMLVPLAQRVLADRKGVVDHFGHPGTTADESRARVGYPIELNGDICGIVVLDIDSRRGDQLQQDLRLVHWGSAWLVAHFSRLQIAERDSRLAELKIATDLLATAMQEPGFGPSALAVVNEMCAHLRCDRVSLGVARRGEIEVKALSHTATFDRRSDLVRFIRQAMEEVLDLDSALAVPQADENETRAMAHEEAARALNDTAICSVPLADDASLVGVITFERATGLPFASDERHLCKTLGLLLGPVFALKLVAERSSFERARDAGRKALHALIGPRHPGVKLIAGSAVCIALFFAFFQLDHRVTAATVVEGEVQRAVAAPFEGFIAEGLVRAGDSVIKGQVLARMEERDLRLEQTRWSSERDQAQRKFRVALAAQDRSGMAVLAAQINQAEAQLQLVEERLARTSLLAPFDGVVVSGDLSQLVGTPVESGKVLFEVAPRDRFRVILKVDERDIVTVKVGQRGEMLLTSLPGQAMKIAVKQLTPVSTPQDGRNYFRVEAQLEDAPAALRPGMEGVGKVNAGRARLIWVWTHPLTDWLRLALWNWMP